MSTDNNLSTTTTRIYSRPNGGDVPERPTMSRDSTPNYLSKGNRSDSARTPNTHTHHRSSKR